MALLRPSASPAATHTRSDAAPKPRAHHRDDPSVPGPLSQLLVQARHELGVRGPS